MELEEETVEREKDIKRLESNLREELDGEQRDWESQKTGQKDRERRNIISSIGSKGARSRAKNDKRRKGVEDDCGSQGASKGERRRYEMAREDWGAIHQISTPPMEQVGYPTQVAKEHPEGAMDIISTMNIPN